MVFNINNNGRLRRVKKIDPTQNANIPDNASIVTYGKIDYLVPNKVLAQLAFTPVEQHQSVLEKMHRRGLFLAKMTSPLTNLVNVLLTETQKAKRLMRFRSVFFSTTRLVPAVDTADLKLKPTERAVLFQNRLYALSGPDAKKMAPYLTEHKMLAALGRSDDVEQLRKKFEIRYQKQLKKIVQPLTSFQRIQLLASKIKQKIVRLGDNILEAYIRGYSQSNGFNDGTFF
ncbi:MAG: hypothetical protein VKJ06_01255 [Vampirovibrionales bacterium]|nr:hypothetical protein [Vampirovibrionales bacterium]